MGWFMTRLMDSARPQKYKGTWAVLSIDIAYDRGLASSKSANELGLVKNV
jgi:hypothetical protein